MLPCSVYVLQLCTAYNTCVLILLSGDTIDNLAQDALLVNARSVAHVIATTAKSTALIDAQATVQAKAKEATGGFGLVDLGFSCRDHHEEL